MPWGASRRLTHHLAGGVSSFPSRASSERETHGRGGSHGNRPASPPLPLPRVPSTRARVTYPAQPSLSPENGVSGDRGRQARQSPAPPPRLQQVYPNTLETRKLMTPQFTPSLESLTIRNSELHSISHTTPTSTTSLPRALQRGLEPSLHSQVPLLLTQLPPSPPDRMGLQPSQRAVSSSDSRVPSGTQDKPRARCCPKDGRACPSADSPGTLPPTPRPLSPAALSPLLLAHPLPHPSQSLILIAHAFGRILCLAHLPTLHHHPLA